MAAIKNVRPSRSPSERSNHETKLCEGQPFTNNGILCGCVGLGGSVSKVCGGGQFLAFLAQKNPEILATK